MPEEINGVTYYTEEEVTNLKTEVEENVSTLQQQLEEANTSKTATEEEKQQLQEDLEKANAELEKFNKKDFNFKKLRDKTEDKDKDKQELTQQVTQTNERLDRVLEGQRKRVIGDVLKDVELDESKRKVFDHYFEKVGGKQADTDEEIAGAARDALTLTLGNEGAIDPLTQVIKTGPGAKNDKKPTETVTPVVQEMRENLKITPEDAKKYDKSKPFSLV